MSSFVSFAKNVLGDVTGRNARKAIDEQNKIIEQQRVDVENARKKAAEELKKKEEAAASAQAKIDAEKKRVATSALRAKTQPFGETQFTGGLGLTGSAANVKKRMLGA